MGRPTQGVKVMNMKDDDCVSAVALVVDDDSTETEPSGQEPMLKMISMLGPTPDPGA